MIKTIPDAMYELTHCHNCHQPHKTKAWRGRSLGLCYSCFKKLERQELKQRAIDDNNAPMQRLSELRGKMIYIGLSDTERVEYNALLAGVAYE